VLVDSDQRQRAGHHGREDHRAVVRHVDQDADGAIVARVPLLGVAEQWPFGAVDHDVGASLERLERSRVELHLHVDLLEGVRRHDPGERLLRPLGHPPHLFDEVRHRGFGRRHVRAEHVIQ
jgi:hypothetical protein